MQYPYPPDYFRSVIVPYTQAGYTPLMLAAACSVDFGDHRDILGHLIDRGGINTVAEKVSDCHPYLTKW